MQVEPIFGVLQRNYMSSLRRMNLFLVYCSATICAVYAGKIDFWCIAAQLYERFMQVGSTSDVFQRNYMSSLRRQNIFLVYCSATI